MENRIKENLIAKAGEALGALVFYGIVAAGCILGGCKFFESVSESEDVDYEGQVTAISLSAGALAVDAGEIDYIQLTVTPSDVQNKISPKWTYDEAFLSCSADAYGATITGLHAGQSEVKCVVNGITARCLVTVEGDIEDYEEPQYITSNYSVIELEPGTHKTVNVSLYGGTSDQYEDFEWSVEDESVASISYARNNCTVTAKRNGSTVLTASNPKNAKYPYSMVIYVQSDELTSSYITTGMNVVSIYRNESDTKNVVFTVKNPVTTNWRSKFTYTDISDEEYKDCIEISAANEVLSIKAKKQGLARVNIHNEECEYDLQILVRVITIVNNVYIELSESSVKLVGSDTAHTVTASVTGYDGIVNDDEFIWEIPEDAYNIADITASGNSLRVQGKKNGYFKVKAGHQLSGEFRRSILFILTQQDGSAVDASMYITTTSNYVATKVGAETSEVQCVLVGGANGDENDFTWTVTSGAGNEVVGLETQTGIIQSRSAVTSGTDAYGKLYITPRTKGSATITVGHPKCLYTTDILVKVYSADALLSPQATINADTGVLKILSGGYEDVTVSLANAASGDENGIKWESDNTNVVACSPSEGPTSRVSVAAGSGSNQTYIRLNHEQINGNDVPEKRILVLSADTEEELVNMKAIWTDSNYIRIEHGGSAKLTLSQVGLTDESGAWDSSYTIKWTSSDAGIVLPGIADSSNPLVATAKGISAGHATVTAAITATGSGEQAGKEVTFDIVVLAEGESADVIKNPYLTTTLNAVVIGSVGGTAELDVTGVDLSDAEMKDTAWEVTDINPDSDGEETSAKSGTDVVQLDANGAGATVTALRKGKSTVKVTNPHAESSLVNPLRIAVKVGSYLEWTDDIFPYIVTDKDTYQAVKGDYVTIAATVENSEEQGSFSWAASGGADLVELTPTGTGMNQCVVETKGAGMAYITVTNTLTADTTGEKTVLLDIRNTAAELDGIKYLTTDRNVVTVALGSTESVSVSAVNYDKSPTTGFTWTSDRSDYVEVSGTGPTAIVSGKAVGSAKISVTQADCDYPDFPLEIVVNCVDMADVTAFPYITAPSVETLTVGSSWTEITADLVGGSERDYGDFEWSITSDDSSKIEINGQNETCKVKAIGTGVASITVSHPKAIDSYGNRIKRNILVICEKASNSKYYISMSEDIVTMKPTDGTYTVTATLVNGDADEAYDFRWSSDNYDIISLSASQGTCLIEPLSTGVANITVSHPLCPGRSKTVIVKITRYDTFTFPQSSMTVKAGTGTQFVTMQVPSTGAASTVAYTSSDTSVVEIQQSTKDICAFQPLSKGSAVISAVWKTTGESAGTILGTADMLVYVEKADENTAYISTSLGTNFLQMQKDDYKVITAEIKMTNSASGLSLDSALTEWYYMDGENKGVFSLTGATSGNMDGGAAHIFTGASVKVTATGYDTKGTILYARHPACASTVKIYITVPQSEKPAIALDSANLTMSETDDAVRLTATIDNGSSEDYLRIGWSCTDESGNNLDMNNEYALVEKDSSGKYVNITPKKIGYFNVLASFTTDDGYTSSSYCSVAVKNAPLITLDHSMVSMTPYSTKTITYTVYPPDDKITWTTGDSSVAVVIDNNDRETQANGTGKGTVKVVGKKTEGVTTLQGKTASLSYVSIAVSNQYNYSLSLSKTIISSTPAQAYGAGSVMRIDYTVSPASAYVLLQKDTAMGREALQNLGIVNASENEISGGTFWKVSHADSDKIDDDKNTRSGYIQLVCGGEINGTLLTEILVPDVIQADGSVADQKENIGSDIDVKVYYPSVDIILSGFRSDGNFSKYKNGMIYLGDGETVCFTPSVDSSEYPHMSLKVSNVKYISDNCSPAIKQACKMAYISKTGNTIDPDRVSDKIRDINPSGTAGEWMLVHTMDYGSGSTPKTYNYYGTTVESYDTEYWKGNHTVVAALNAGTAAITYWNYALSKYTTFSVKIYVEVRNCTMNDSN